MTAPFSPRRVCGALSTIFLLVTTLGAAPSSRVDWSSFLARHDLVWAANPSQWEDAPFIGNGNLGASIYLRNDTLAWEINRADFLFERSRYPMGRAYLVTAGKITGGEARLDLWNAEARGTLKTDRGTVRWRSYTASEPSVIAIELEGSDGEKDVKLDWVAAEVRSPRKLYRKERLLPADLHPPGEIKRTADGFEVSHQLIDGPAFAISARQVVAGPKTTHLIAVSKGANLAEALPDATHTTERAAALGGGELEKRHRAWWHAYFPQSFVSVPDARLESFYWIQIYKLGAAMRPDGPVLDLMGPWFRYTPWPRIWWNLNVQLTYHPLMTANRLPLAESLFTALDRKRQALIDNVPEKLRATAAAIGRSSDQSLVSPIDLGTADGDAGLEAGNLPWVAFIYWEFYRYQMDDQVLRDRVYPLLSRAMGHYLGYVYKGPDGHYHLPKTHSPEFASVPDTNYDLAFLRWGLRTLIETCRHLKIDEPQLPHWKNVLANLVAYPVNETGLMIGRDRSLDASHRHYSHLMAIYPLRLITPDKAEDRALIEKSLRHWHSMPEKHQGYSHTGAASMFAMMEDGGRALHHLHQLLNTYIKPNTMYTEAGPVIETPLSAVTSLQEMLLQSWGGKLRVFSAVPSSWADLAFESLRGEGAFLVSAVRRGGRTAWVRIESQAGEPCRLVVRDWKTAVIRSSANADNAKITAQGAGEFVLAIPRGGSVTLAADDTVPLPDLEPTATPAAGHNPYPQRYR